MKIFGSFAVYSWNKCEIVSALIRWCDLISNFAKHFLNYKSTFYGFCLEAELSVINSTVVQRNHFPLGVIKLDDRVDYGSTTK